jgi:hypothetical protein
MCAGYAVDDGVALHFKGTQLDSVVSSRERGGAFHVQRVGDEAMETALEVSYLGERTVAAKRGGRAGGSGVAAARAVALA